MIPLDMKTLPILGEPQPQADGIDIPFWEALNAGHFKMQRCGDCAEWIWSPQWRCGDCGSWNVIWEETPAVGIVHSWTRNYQAFLPEWADLIPYVTLMVELPHAGSYRLMGLLIGSEEKLQIGAEVVGVIQPGKPPYDQAVMRWKLADQGTGESSQ